VSVMGLTRCYKTTVFYIYNEVSVRKVSISKTDLQDHSRTLTHGAIR